MAIWTQSSGTISDDDLRGPLEIRRDRLAPLEAQTFGSTKYPIENQVKRVAESMLTTVSDIENIIGSLSLLDLGFSPQGLMRDLKSAQELKIFLENVAFSNSRVTAIYLSPTTTSTIMRTRTEARQYEYHVLNAKNSIRLVVKDAYALFRLFHRMFMYEHSVYPQLYLKRSTLVLFHCGGDDLDYFGGKFGPHLPLPGGADDDDELNENINDDITSDEGVELEENDMYDEGYGEVLNVTEGGSGNVVYLSKCVHS